jgi:hypothetical protein
MADDKIVHRISLEGAEDVANKLKKIGDTSSDAFKKVKESVDGSGSGIAGLGNAFAGIEGKTEGGRLAAERFRETIHTLHPILDSAGLGLGNLGAFARVAGVGLAALIFSPSAPSLPAHFSSALAVTMAQPLSIAILKTAPRLGSVSSSSASIE